MFQHMICFDPMDLESSFYLRIALISKVDPESKAQAPKHKLREIGKTPDTLQGFQKIWYKASGPPGCVVPIDDW